MDLKEQYEKLLKYCYMKLNNRETAEDIVQETFLKFWQSRSYKDTGREMAYLYTIARNLCVDELRKPVTESLDEHFDLPCENAQSPEAVLENKELQSALEKLPEELREIIVLRYTDEISVTDIAKITGMSRYAVHRRLNEGLDCLKRMLKGERK